MLNLNLNHLCINRTNPNKNQDLYITTDEHIYPQLQEELDQVIMLINLLDSNIKTNIVNFQNSIIIYLYINNLYLNFKTIDNILINTTLIKGPLTQFELHQNINNKTIYTNTRFNDPYHTLLKSLIYIKHAL